MDEMESNTATKLDSGLDEAKKRGWTLVSMKKDWKRVFAFEKNFAELIQEDMEIDDMAAAL